MKKIRFIEEWPTVKDETGSFGFFCVTEHSGPSLDLITRFPKEELGTGDVRIYAKSAGSDLGFLICHEYFKSCREASEAMQGPGVDFVSSPSVTAYLNRCIACGKAEFVS